MSDVAESVVFDCNIFAQALITPFGSAGQCPPNSIYLHPIDPKDSHYIDLAVATNSKLVVSRDKPLLHLMDRSKPGAIDFMARFPHLAVLRPEQLLDLLRA